MKNLFLSLVFISSSFSMASDVSGESAGNSQGFVEGAESKKSLPYESLEVTSLPFDTKDSFQLQKFGEKIEELVNNDEVTEDGYLITQTEANEIVSNFVEYNLDRPIVDSAGFRGSLKIDGLGKRAQAMQLITNIVETQKTMAKYLSLGNVKCWFRNYKDPFAVVNDLSSTKEMNPSPAKEILLSSQEAVVVGYCRGCGLLNSPEFSEATPKNKYGSVCPF